MSSGRTFGFKTLKSARTIPKSLVCCCYERLELRLRISSGDSLNAQPMMATDGQQSANGIGIDFEFPSLTFRSSAKRFHWTFSGAVLSSL